MTEYNYNYIDGSAARKLEYDVYEDNELLRAKRQYKDNRKQKAGFVFSLVVVVLAALVVMFRFAMITQISYNINSSEQAYAEMKNNNALLRLQIDKETDLASIRQAAETRLGMQDPDKSQMVYISVPRNDYTVVMNSDSEKTGPVTAFLEDILEGSAAGVASLLAR
ncbi:MAG: cell division protein FtsL [Clostridiales bacterium]|nr:cell division protein FtsL [Clostridiales bacterium]